MIDYEGKIAAIHADWPAYPVGNTWHWALEALSIFPIGTRFYRIDHIDACSLFVTRKPKEGEDVYGETFIHIAIFDEDLNELHNRNLVRGITPQTEYDWRLEEYHDLLSESKGRTIGYLDSEGKFRPVELRPPVPDPDKEEWAKNCRFAFVETDGMVVLQPALNALISELDEQGRDLHPALAAEVDPLIAARKFDTAVREAGVVLETRLRILVSDPSNPHGTQLIRAFEAFRLRVEGGQLCAVCTTLLAELRGLYRYIRNVFAHNKITLEGVQFSALLHRYSAILTLLDEIERSDAEA